MSAAPVPATSGAVIATQPTQQRAETSTAPRFAIGDDDFLLDGAPFRILSGALHYFRVHPDQWADRIAKARQMGLNTIETYVAWNVHAPTEDAFDLTGGLDLARFLDLVADAGMYAIVRPGPYICAEWTNGGLPAWLFRTGTTGIRRDEPTFMAAVDAYFEQLAPDHHPAPDQPWRADHSRPGRKRVRRLRRRQRLSPQTRRHLPPHRHRRSADHRRPARRRHARQRQPARSCTRPDRSAPASANASTSCAATSRPGH